MKGAVLETERLVLREYRWGDLNALAGHFADQDVMAFYPGTKNRAEAAGWIGRNLESYADHGFGHWVVTPRGRDIWIGNVGFWVQEVDGRSEVELGWHITRRLWRKGVATEAARACLEHGRSSLGLTRVVSMIRPENFPSVGVAEKLGMHLERKLEWRGFLHGLWVSEPGRSVAGEIGI